MRVGIIGKGGSGKTSTSWMLLQAAQAAGFESWGLDADYNQHLADMFGSDPTDIRPLAQARADLIAYVIGKRTDLAVQDFDKLVLPNSDSHLIDLNVADPWLKDYAAHTAGDICLLRVGSNESVDLGLKCYHACTTAADILLSHLQQREDQFLLVDFTAGVDPLASPLYLKVDVLVLVVEPTLKGVAVARQWAAALADKPAQLLIVGNKLNGSADREWLAAQLSPLPLTAGILHEPAIVRIERGECISLGDLLPDNRITLQALMEELRGFAGYRAEEKLRELERLQALRQKAKPGAQMPDAA